jgi:DMSO/TMAO reductase YedYZ molybdopterin-dependent catalytic subunit
VQARLVRRTTGALVGATLGIATAGAALGVAHLVAGIVDPAATPIVAVGQATIDLTPEPVKSFAIRTFGEHDKTALLAGIGLVLGAAAAALGIAALRRPAAAAAALGLFGLIGAAAALTRPTATWTDGLPVLAGVATGWWVLRRLASATGHESPPRGVPDPRGPAVERRRFVVSVAGVAIATAASGWIGSALARRAEVPESRAAVRLPEPASAPSPASGAALDVPGLSPYLTPNSRFYRVDTALIVPSIRSEDWRLRIHGMVDHELVVDFAQLLDRPLIERDITLTCVSNPVGGRYAGNARWLGAPLAPLLEEAGVDPAADQLVSRSVDGFTIGTPTADVMDGRDAMLAVGMNGEPLPLAHGFPVRMVVPGLYGYVSATKWLVDLELTTFAAFEPYWVSRGWASRAPVKTMSRIDTPNPLLPVDAGHMLVAGVAWAQGRGIERVEVQIDEEPWIEAELATETTVDTWRQWARGWDARPGRHRLRVRATDRSGVTQPEERSDPLPDGATGWHTVVVEVR